MCPAPGPPPPENEVPAPRGTHGKKECLITVAKLSIQLVLMVSIGVFAVKKRVVYGDFQKQLVSFVMTLVLPCLIINSMTGAFSVEELKNCGLLLVISAAMWVLSFALGQAVHALLGKTSTARILRYSVIYTNFTFVGIPVFEALYGEKGVFYLMVFIVPYRVMYYLTSEALLTPAGLLRKDRSRKEQLKEIFSPPLVAVIVGLFLYLTQIPLPSPLAGAIKSLSGCASPLGMILCGMSIARYDFKTLLKPKYVWLPMLRNLLVPAIFTGLALLFRIPAELASIAITFSALPVASLLATFTVQYDPNQEAQFEAAATVLFSTVFTVFTIPLWAAVLSRIY